ncbi:hypothetical protein CCL24_00005 [Pseudomonas congelans]|nr:hypothetical protein CCL24_00005 [Pseudomonas congelans]
MRNDNLNHRATLRVGMPFRTLCVLLGGATLRVQGIKVMNVLFSDRVARILQPCPENLSCSITCGSSSPPCSRYSVAMPSGYGYARARARCG